MNLKKSEQDTALFLQLWNQNEIQLQKIQECNTYTQKFGLALSEQDALALVEERKNCLKEQERVEFGEGILSKIIFAFCDSPYIYQDNYVETIAELQRIFYLYKNESMDELTDDEVLSFMKKGFDGVCEGSLDNLEDTYLTKFARAARYRKLPSDPENWED